jgi:hypothetical protein
MSLLIHLTHAMSDTQDCQMTLVTRIHVAVYYVMEVWRLVRNAPRIRNLGS